MNSSSTPSIGQQEDWDFLFSSDGTDLLEWIRTCGLREFTLAAALRERTTPARAALLTLTAQLRVKAQAKFSRAERMFFTRDALEQASAEIVSAHRAQRFADAGVRHVADLGCGIGGDAIPLAAHARVTGFDLDPVRLRIAAANLLVYDRAEHFTARHEDFTAVNPRELAVDAFFIDPARRDEAGNRLLRASEYRPPLTELSRWRDALPGGCAKLGPGIDRDAIPDGAETEFISVGGELREAVAWFGQLRTGRKSVATVFPSGACLCGENPDIGCGGIRAWLHEPDPAVIRSGLVELAGSLLDAQLLDPRIAYVSGDAPPPPAFPFARSWRIEEWMPYEERALKRRLAAIGAGNLYLKRRGPAIDLDALRKRLRVPGPASRTVILTYHHDRVIALLCVEG